MPSASDSSTTVSRRGLTFLGQALLLGPSPALLAVATDWYVDASAADCAAGNGSQATPFCTVTEAIDASGDGDTIYVAAGTYIENLTVDKDLDVIGSEDSFVTVIDGALGGRVLTIAGSACTEWTGLSFVRGSSSTGGGVFIGSAATLSLTNCSVRDCTTASYGPYGTSFGGGILVDDGATLALADSLVEGNSTFSGGFAFGGGIYLRSGGIATIQNSTIRANSVCGDCPNGGGISAEGGTVLSIVRSVVSGNSVIPQYGYARGSALSIAGDIFNPSQLEIVDSSIVENNCGSPCSGVSSIYLGGSTTTLLNSTIAGNASGSTIAISSSGGVSANLNSCVVWGNGGGRSLPSASNVSVSFSDIEGGWSGAGTGNIDEHPLFTDPTNGDYSLRTASPCIDAGDSTVLSTNMDIMGSPRVLDGHLDRFVAVDMGAFEFSNITLSARGSLAPGGALTVDATGTSGLIPYLVVGDRTSSPVLLQPWGPLYVLPPFSTQVMQLGPIPNSIGIPIPSSLPVPMDFTIQAVGFGTSLPSGLTPGNFSNPVTVQIR